MSYNELLIHEFRHFAFLNGLVEFDYGWNEI
jgi:hypothetical protein